MPSAKSPKKKKIPNQLAGFTEGQLIDLKHSLSSQGSGFIWKDKIENELKKRPVKK